MNKDVKGYSRREFISSLAGAAAAMSLAGLISACNGQSGKRPNVLVLQPDQHRGTVMGCAGYRQAITPNLDRMADGGIRFTHCTSSSPVCSPFRSSFQTGMYPHKHGVLRNDMLLDPAHITFAEVFAAAGYATGYIGKWHLDSRMLQREAPGFIPPGGRRQGWQEWLGRDGGGSFFDVWRFDEEGNRVPVEGYDWEPTWHTDMALDFIRRKRDEGQPWLYYVSYRPPHAPLDCPQEYLDMYDPDAFKLPPDLQGKYDAAKEWELRQVMQAYYGQVTAIDAEVGRILDGLKELGVDDNTIILYTSDHGERFGSHYDGPQMGRIRGKGAPYATAFRIPFLIRWPGRIKPGQVCDTLVSSVDLSPTLLGLAGLKIPRSVQGDSMASWCLKGRGKRNEALYLGIGGGQNDKRRQSAWRAVWDGRYVFCPLGFQILYDHQTDPYEMNNLFDLPEHAAVRRRMEKVLISLAEKTEDPLLPQVREACGI